MKKRDKKIIAIIILIGIIAIISTIFIAIFLIKNQINNAEINRKSGELVVKENVPPKERREVIDETKIIKETGTDKIPTNFDKVNYQENALYQFKEISKGDDILEIKFKNGPVVKAKMFNKIAPNLCKEIEILANQGKLNGLIAGGCTFSDLCMNNKNPYQTILSKPYIEEVNYNLVPYRGSLTTDIVVNEKNNYIKTGLKLILEKLRPDDEEYLDNYNFPNSLKQEAKKRGGRYYNNYLQNVVFGQIVENLDVLEKYLDEAAKHSNPSGAEGMSVEIESVKYIKN